MPTTTGEPRREPAAPDTVEECIEQAYIQFAPLLRDIAEHKFHIPAPDAEALTNAVFHAYLQQQRTVRNLQKYLIASVCNAARDYWRAKKKTEPLPPDINDFVDATTEDTEERIIRQITLAVALTRLGRRCSDALMLHHLGGYSVGELASMFGKKEEAMKKTLSRCRARAQNVFRKIFGSPL